MRVITEHIRLNKVTGEYEYNIYDYSQFFDNNFQDRIEGEYGKCVRIGLTLEGFVAKLESNPKRFNEEFIKPLYTKIVADEELTKLQDEVEEKAGISIDFPNFYMLCLFVNTLVRDSYFLLLKPTIKDTIAELKEVKEITITNADKTKVTLDDKALMDSVIKTIKEKAEDNNCYRIEKLVRIDSIVNNVVMQSKFAYLIALFLKKYFLDAKRRKNCCMVSEPEQRLILRMLTFFKLAPEKYTLSSSRFRQLISCYHDLKVDDDIVNFPMGYVRLTTVKYEDWHRKTIDWTKTNLVLHPLKVGDTILTDNLKEVIDDFLKEQKQD